VKLNDYFEKTTGRGILATADSHGIVSGAVYSRPHFMDDDTIAFIMADRLTHKNIQSNPHAAYIFIESGKGLSERECILQKLKKIPTRN